MTAPTNKDRAWNAALAVAAGDKKLAAVVLRNAELDVIRGLVQAMVGTESAYWAQVAHKVRP